MTMLLISLLLFVVVAMLWRGLASDEGKGKDREKGRADAAMPEWPARRVMPEMLAEFGEEVTPERKGDSPESTLSSEGRSAASSVKSSANARSEDKRMEQAVAAHAERTNAIAEERADRFKQAARTERAEQSELAERSDRVGAVSDHEMRRGEEAAIAVRALSDRGSEDEGWQAAYSSHDPFSLRSAETATESELPSSGLHSADAEFSAELGGRQRAPRRAFAAANRAARREAFALREAETKTEAAEELAPGAASSASSVTSSAMPKAAATPAATSASTSSFMKMEAGEELSPRPAVTVEAASKLSPADLLAADAASMAELQKQFDKLSDELATMQLTAQTLQVLSELGYNTGQQMADMYDQSSDMREQN